MLKLQAKCVAIWADVHNWTVHCVRSSEWSTLNEMFTYINMSDLIYVYQTNVDPSIWGCQRVQKPSPNGISPTIFLRFSFRSCAPPMTLLTVGTLTDPSCPRLVQTCARLVQGWVALSGWTPPPNKDPGYAYEEALPQSRVAVMMDS